jgi:hypothetical protein
LVPPRQRKEVPKDAMAKMRLRLAAVERRFELKFCHDIFAGSFA